jgi:glyoxylase-like metal-dependent hydrolase (beta-lactamase superfamily II)
MNELDFADKFLKTCGRGEVIFHEGSIGSHMYVISSGTVDISARKDGVMGKLATLGKGAIFGEMALVDRLPRSATATAAEDNTQVLEIDHALFVYLVGQQPTFALIIQKALSLRLRAALGGQELPEEPDAAAGGIPAERKGSGVLQLKENIYQLRGQCMSYLIRGSRKNLLIDTGLPWDTAQLEGQLSGLGLGREDIHIVVLTHEHLDHIGGVPLFSPRTVIAAHTLAANKISMQDEFVLMSKAFHFNVDEYHVDIHLHHGTKIDLGGCVLSVHHTPGHSSGSICLYEPEQQILFSGDTIFGGGVLGGIFPSGSISDYILSLRYLDALRIKEIHPGHGKMSSTPAEDFEKAIRSSKNLVSDTRSLFNALDAREEFAQISKAVSTYSKRV